MTRFAGPEATVVASPRPKTPASFFLPDALTNREHVQYALKTTAAAMFCYCLYTLLDWPGIHTSFITCYIVALTTAAEAVEKLTLRVIGCLVGAATGIAAIVLLVPSLTSIGELMIVVFVGAFVSAWVAAGGPRIAYAGFQIAFAFFLCMIQGSAPAFDMAIARDRVIGILIGNIVSYLVFTLIWPVSVTQRIDPAIAALLRRLSAMVSEPGTSARRAAAAEVMASREAVERDLQLASYEPSWLRPHPSWLRHRHRTVRKIMALTGPLLLEADRTPNLSIAIGRRLNMLADMTSHGTAPVTGESAQLAAEQVQRCDLVALIDGHLGELERVIGADRSPAYAPR
jgi:multidrug resistance protein MdtO